jgi:hypothetical protein
VSSKSIALILLLGFVALIVNLTGFCYLQLRYVPNRELFERAISHQAYKMGDYSLSDTPASYLAKHPDCCSIPDFQPTNSLLDVLLGNRIRYVRVVFRRPQAEIDKYPRSGEFYEAFVEVTPCGTTGHAIGTSRDDMN